MRPLVWLLAAALVVAAAAGCADGDEDAAGTTPAETTAAPPAATPADETRPEPPEDQTRWAREVDVACEPWQERIDAVAPPADDTDLERWLGETLPLIRKQVAAVDAVPSPPAAAARFVDSLRAVEGGLTRYSRALRRGDAEAARQALAEAGAAGAAARDRALALGVTECGGYSTG